MKARVVCNTLCHKQSPPCMTEGEGVSMADSLLNSSDGCGFFAYSWKLPAYSGAFLLTVDNFSFFTYSWNFLAYSGKVRLIKALRDCKQRSLTVSKKAPTVSKKASPEFFA